MSGETWQVPVGWIGTIPGCDEPRIAQSSRVQLKSGWLHALEPGGIKVACKDGKLRKLVVVAVDRLRIEGPAEVGVDRFVYYRAVAVSKKGESLPLNGETRVDWTVPEGSEIEPGYCGELPLFGCPDHDSARFRARRAGVFKIEVSHGPNRVKLQVTAK